MINITKKYNKGRISLLLSLLCLSMAFISTSMAASNKSDYIMLCMKKVWQEEDPAYIRIFVQKTCTPKQVIDSMTLVSDNEENDMLFNEWCIFSVGKRQDRKTIGEKEQSRKILKRLGLPKENPDYSNICKLEYGDRGTIEQILTPNSIRLCTKKQVYDAFNGKKTYDVIGLDAESSEAKKLDEYPYISKFEKIFQYISVNFERMSALNEKLANKFGISKRKFVTYSILLWGIILTVCGMLVVGIYKLLKKLKG